MKKKGNNRNWLDDKFVKESVSKGELIEKWIKELGEEIVENLIKEKMSNLIDEGVDKNLYDRGFKLKTIYRSRKK